MQPQTSVSDSDETYTKSTLGTAQSIGTGEQKVLGVRWEVVTDKLCFRFAEIAQRATELEPTKHNLVSVIGKFYDLNGYFTLIVI